ncbi:hypothetical protein [Asanoa ishikariensis]|uniref:hypothetical protein n=1 Tax=Asanoa ishikariensis TaxID=137265 RepID=UPI001160011A|nr:hypothetical protein [Asanoa ishikariensis]
MPAVLAAWDCDSYWTAVTARDHGSRRAVVAAPGLRLVPAVLAAWGRARPRRIALTALIAPVRGDGAGPADCAAPARA